MNTCKQARRRLCAHKQYMRTPKAQPALPTNKEEACGYTKERGQPGTARSLAVSTHPPVAYGPAGRCLGHCKHGAEEEALRVAVAQLVGHVLHYQRQQAGRRGWYKREHLRAGTHEACARVGAVLACGKSRGREASGCVTAAGGSCHTLASLSCGLLSTTSSRRTVQGLCCTVQCRMVGLRQGLCPEVPSVHACMRMSMPMCA